MSYERYFSNKEVDKGRFAITFEKDKDL